MVCALAARGGRVLAARRSAERLRGGLWEFPGGKVEYREDPREALARELEEEFGCQARVGEYVASASHAYADIDIVLDAYIVELVSPLRRLSDHDALAWMEPEGLSHLEFAPADLPILAVLKEKALGG